MSKGYLENAFSNNSPQVQGGNKSVNLGFRKAIDNAREALKCWGCGEPHLLRNCPHRNSTNRTIKKIQEASTVGDIGKSIHRINVAIDGKQAYHQSTIVKIQGKIHDRKIYILIDLGASLNYVM
jgi:hypothetical protein